MMRKSPSPLGILIGDYTIDLLELQRSWVVRVVDANGKFGSAHLLILASIILNSVSVLSLFFQSRVFHTGEARLCELDRS
jgi:hypothetical protein